MDTNCHPWSIFAPFLSEYQLEMEENLKNEKVGFIDCSHRLNSYFRQLSILEIVYSFKNGSFSENTYRYKNRENKKTEWTGYFSQKMWVLPTLTKFPTLNLLSLILIKKCAASVVLTRIMHV